MSIAYSCSTTGRCKGSCRAQELLEVSSNESVYTLRQRT